MRPERQSRLVLAMTRSRAKMLEYSVPEAHRITLSQDPGKLFSLCIGLLGDLSASLSRQYQLNPSGQSDLIFAAQFFDSYLNGAETEDRDVYLLLLGSASYYLSAFPGSASVLIKEITGDWLNIGGGGLEDLLLWAMRSDMSTYLPGWPGYYSRHIEIISAAVSEFFRTGSNPELVIDHLEQLRKDTYESGTARQLLLCDIIGAVLRTKIGNSSWICLAYYSGLTSDRWASAITKPNFPSEFWPAQHLLGQAGVLRGRSAVVQMPTSAGKTKASEITIRSAFLSGRARLVVIVAPFRALCHEIRNSLADAFEGDGYNVDELSDIPQFDFNMLDSLGENQVIVATPEKLLYILRQSPELAREIGLAIFDEGHQFDSGSRGVTYELLLTSLRMILPVGAQKILISAVISNAASIGHWLNGDTTVVAGAALTPTIRSVGFASWLDTIGRIEFMSPANLTVQEFFVPRVITRRALPPKPRERTARFFPDKNDGKSVALYLGFKMVKQGAVAIFCGRKDTASGLCSTVADIFSRNAQIAPPLRYSDQSEVAKIQALIEANLGTTAAAALSAAVGVFSHHGNTPHGIRLAVEHAMRAGSIKFVVCTSTLAQGVNLPIRYLIVTGVYQGREKISTRDFHNLIGRAGRAGMHTEGTIIFADPAVFDSQSQPRERWRWNQAVDMFGDTEPCESSILSIFKPIKSDDGRSEGPIDPLGFAQSYLQDPAAPLLLARQYERTYSGFTFDGVLRQVTSRLNLLGAIESFLMANVDVDQPTLDDAQVVTLATNTLAYWLASEVERFNLLWLFRALASNISSKVPDPGLRRAFGKTLYGVHDILEIRMWVRSNRDRLVAAQDESEMFHIIWPILRLKVKNRTFSKFNDEDALKGLAVDWIRGASFASILSGVERRGGRMIWGTLFRDFTVEHIVDACEGGLAFDGPLLVGAIVELFALQEEGLDEVVSLLKLLQKRLKYGLPTVASISYYELGFTDRVASQRLHEALHIVVATKNEATQALRDNLAVAMRVIDRLPSYFATQMPE